MEQEININRKIAFGLLSIWWGAFTFYAGIVVPVGMKVLASHTKMGFITQEVTNYLNYFSLSIFLYTTFVFRIEKRLFRLSILLVILQISLFALHCKLAYLLDFQSLTVKSRDFFYSLHQIYLLISTVIWLIVSGLMFVEVRRR